MVRRTGVELGENWDMTDREGGVVFWSHMSWDVDDGGQQSRWFRSEARSRLSRLSCEESDRSGGWRGRSFRSEARSRSSRLSCEETGRDGVGRRGKSFKSEVRSTLSRLSCEVGRGCKGWQDRLFSSEARSRCSRLSCEEQGEGIEGRRGIIECDSVQQ